MPPLDLITLALVATVSITVAAALLAWRERSQPGAKPLVAMLVGECWWSVFLVFELHSATLAEKAFWSDVQWVGVVVIPVAWLLFALEYTGRDEYVHARYVALLSVVPAITVLLALTGEYHDFLYTESKLVEQGGRVIISRTGGPWYWVIAGYTYFLGLLGTIPLLGYVRSVARPFRGQSVAVLVGILSPWAINALFLAGLTPIPGLDPTPIGFAISGVAYLAALTRFRLLGTSPAPNRSARRLVFEWMHDGAVVVDGNDNVVDMNQEAAAVLGADPSAVLGSPASDVIPGYHDLPRDGPASDHLTIQTADGTHFYDASVTEIDDSRGRAIGRVITFHDVGEHLRQQQRLAVLNRVLRHNIKNETNLICGYADLIVESGDVSLAHVVRKHGQRVEELAEKARTIADLFDREGEPDEARSLDDLLRERVESVREAFPNVAVEYEPVDREVHVAGVFGPVFWNVIDNAARHNTNADPRVWISAEADDTVARVSVADNGPGIDEFERVVLERGEETPLSHGTGLGLWLVTWGTRIAGGQVSFESNEPAGSVVTIEAPRLPRPEADREEPDLLAG